MIGRAQTETESCEARAGGLKKMNLKNYQATPMHRGTGLSSSGAACTKDSSEFFAVIFSDERSTNVVV